VIRVVLLTIILISTREILFCQDIIDVNAEKILDRALGDKIQQENIAIYFESIAYSIKNPLSIFTLPTYAVVKGGFLIADGKKYEIQLGKMKSLCNGKIFIVIDDDLKAMYIDSLRENGINDTMQVSQIDKMLQETFGDAKLSLLGDEIVNGNNCYKILAEFSDENHSGVYYWVNKLSGKLLMMADRNGKEFDVYVIRQITNAPVKYDFTINIPSKEVNSLYGYEVFDNRFISEELNSK
jgi:hypothetical protein